MLSVHEPPFPGMEAVEGLPEKVQVPPAAPLNAAVKLKFAAGGNTGALSVIELELLFVMLICSVCEPVGGLGVKTNGFGETFTAEATPGLPCKGAKTDQL